MARRNRPRVVWFPNGNTFSVDSSTTRLSTYQTFVHNVPGDQQGDDVVSFMPVITDQPADAINTNSTLSDLENSGYRLRRIVGKVFVSVDQFAEPGPALIACTAGFIILRCDAVGVPLNPDIEAYGPNIIDTNDSPWIWRRTWIIGNALADDPATQGVFQLGGSNYGLIGGNQDGPHVDAKTARLVGKDERLFMVASSTALRPGAPTLITACRWFTDLRVLGSMRTSLGNRRNASR